MKNIFFLLICMPGFLFFAKAQNVGINNTSPTEKLHIDSGNIKIGKLPWGSPANSHFLKFGDANFVILGAGNSIT